VRFLALNKTKFGSITDEAVRFDNTTSLAVGRKHKPDYKILIYMGMLMLLGLVVMYAIGPQRANVLNNVYGSNYSDTYFFVKQAISLALSLLAFAFVSIIPFDFFIKNSSKFLWAGFGACLLLAIASWTNLGIAQESLGATRWFNLGALGSIQPSEILKFSILLFTASFLGVRVKQGKQNCFMDTLLPVGIIAFLAIIFVIIIQKDLGTGIAIIGIIMTTLFVSGINNKNIALITLSMIVVGTLLIVSQPHRIARVETFIRGDSASSSEGYSGSYHIEQARIAIGTGGLFGVGIGNSVQSTGYLPEATNDSVFAIMGETFGFTGLIVILGLFTALMIQLLRQMDHQKDERNRLIIAGVFGWLCSHVILNIASMIGLVPLTGITLPLLSFGGTSMLFFSAALGLVFQLSRYSVHPSSLKESQYESSYSRRGIGRSRYTGSRGSTRN
jgi:cell division protein FtsW